MSEVELLKGALIQWIDNAKRGNHYIRAEQIIQLAEIMLKLTEELKQAQEET